MALSEETVLTPGLEGNGAASSLVDRCKEGQEWAFTAVYQQHAAQVLRQLRGILGRGSEAEDALQQTFIQAFRNIHRFEKRSKLSTWLHGIAVRVALNTIRGRRRRDRAMTSVTQETTATPQRRPTSPEARMIRREDMERLRRHLADAPAASQVAFTLYYVEQLELGEVATQLGVSSGTAWARIKRARDRVLEAMVREQRMRSKVAP